MKLTNEFFKIAILRGLSIEIGQTFKLKEIWTHLYKQGYREDMIKFMEVLEVRFGKHPFLEEEIVRRALGSTGEEYLTEKKFLIQNIEIVPVEETDYVEDKGKYKVECFGAHFDETHQEWSNKSTMMFSLRLQER